MANVTVEIRITYNLRGGTNGPTFNPQVETKSIDEASLPYTYNVRVSYANPTKEYSTFKGWSYSPSSTVNFAPGSIYSHTFTGAGRHDRELFAVWETIQYTVSFNANGGTGAPSSMQRDAGTTNRLPSSVPVREGYQFSGWCRNRNGTGTIYPAESYYTWTKDETLYAIWIEVGSSISLSANRVPMDGSTVTTITLTKSRSDIDHHTVEIELGSSTLLFQNVGLTQQFTLPLSWNNELPEDVAKEAVIRVRSYLTNDDSTPWGQNSVVTFTAFVPEAIVPSVSIIEQQMGNQVAVGWGVYVQSYSSVKFNVTASGLYSATIKSIDVNGTTISAHVDGSSIEVASDIFAGLGDFVYTIIATDSRGRSNVVYRTVSVVQYFKPSIVGLNAYRSNSSGDLDDVEGAYLTVKHTGANVAVSQYNQYVVEYKYKIYRTSSYTSISNDAQANTNYTVSADISKTYVVNAKITDSFGAYTEIELVVDSVVCSLALGLNNDRARFGGACRQAGLEVDWDSKFNGRITAPDHFQRGFVSVRTVTAGSVDEVTVQFASAFQIAPNVVATIYQSQSVGNVVLTIYGITASQFKLRIENNNAYDVDVGAIWIAIL